MSMSKQNLIERHIIFFLGSNQYSCDTWHFLQKKTYLKIKLPYGYGNEDLALMNVRVIIS
jgi:tyrosine-protein phosphatase YwqE